MQNGRFSRFYYCKSEHWLTVSGGDATKNGDFPIRKQRSQGSIFYYHYIIIKLFENIRTLRGDVDEMIDFESVK